MTLFERIQFAAEKQKKSVIKVAEEAGLSEKAIYRYKQGVTPRKSTLLAIARAIPTSIEFLEGNRTYVLYNYKIHYYSGFYSVSKNTCVPNVRQL